MTGTLVVNRVIGLLPSSSTDRPISQSVSIESLGSELFTSRHDRLSWRRLNFIEGIAQFELFPLESPHLMKRENVDSLDVTEARGESRDMENLFGVVRQTRHQDEAKPNRPFTDLDKRRAKSRTGPLSAPVSL